MDSEEEFNAFFKVPNTNVFRQRHMLNTHQTIIQEFALEIVEMSNKISDLESSLELQKTVIKIQNEQIEDLKDWKNLVNDFFALQKISVKKK